MLRLIVSSHGKLAEELVESSYMIFGRQDGVFALEFESLASANESSASLFDVVLTAEVTKINLFGPVSDDAHQSIGSVFVRQVSGIA